MLVAAGETGLVPIAHPSKIALFTAAFRFDKIVFFEKKLARSFDIF